MTVYVLMYGDKLVDIFKSEFQADTERRKLQKLYPENRYKVFSQTVR